MLHHLPILLAQADTPAVAWSSLVVSIVVAVLLVVQHFRPNPPNHRQFAAREDLAALARRVDDCAKVEEVHSIGVRLEQMSRLESEHFEKIMGAGSTRARNMYEKIDAVRDDLSKLAVRVARIEGKMGIGDTNGQD